MHGILGDLPAMVVAIALIAGDVVLHLAHEAAAAGPFDAAIPILVAVYIGGRSSAATIIALNGKAQTPPSVSVQAQAADSVKVSGPPNVSQ